MQPLARILGFHIPALEFTGCAWNRNRLFGCRFLTIGNDSRPRSISGAEVSRIRGIGGRRFSLIGGKSERMANCTRECNAEWSGWWVADGNVTAIGRHAIQPRIQYSTGTGEVLR